MVLVVDDIEASRRELCALVERLGHEALGAAGGDAALDLVHERRPDIVLLDLLMPDVDGFEVTRRLRVNNLHRWLPVIVTSSLQGDEHFIHALEGGADDFLVRPVNPALLGAKLRHYQRVLAEQRRIDRMKDEFLAAVSHEMRTPLTSVLGALGLLASGAAGTLPEAARPLAEAAQRNGQRLSQLIDDILDLTKLEGDRLLVHASPVAMAALVREACAANRAYGQRGGVAIAQDIDPLAEGLVLELDPNRFLQVMANLLSNAVKHSPSGATVEVSLRRTPGSLAVRVHDHGPGIDPAFRPRLFQKFEQADSSDRRAIGGTGLGLYLSRMLVERMGGRIDVESPAGGGTVFVVEFPLARDQARQAQCRN